MPATATPDTAEAGIRYKMRLHYDEYLSDVSGNRGRFPAGAVLLVDAATAERWYENNVAEPAPPDAEVYGEIKRRSKREEFLRRAQPAEGVFDKAVTRQSFGDERSAMPPPMPQPSRRPRRADLAGADVATDGLDDER